MAHAFAEAELSETTAFAVLNLDGQRWLIPQNEILSLETVLDIETHAASNEGEGFIAPDPIGFITRQEQVWPIYCLTGHFSRPQEVPKSRRIVVLLHRDPVYLGLVCDEIEVLGQDHGPFQPVPACMGQATQVLGALLSYASNLAYMTTTTRLATFLKADMTRGMH
ncbi:MAG: hypothetical protein H6970_04250 [Gammaproteobacteria bacterium]|nr:hypothetical protein [Gammaproteobacteria bacterium]MCP5424260.1 hypothetical protein [Gammaproteobacteria bacterium]MCP5458866.1 hypothetical protein [Gammaproteobacteria bacterium]